MEVVVEFLIFKGLPAAITGAILMYLAFGRKKKTPKKENINPVELEDGRYALEKPEQKYMTGLEPDEVITDPKFKVDAEAQVIPNPSGPPPKGGIK